MSKILSTFVACLFILSCQNVNEGKKNNTKRAENLSKTKTIIDLSHDFSAETIYWVTAKEFKLDTVFNGQTDKGYFYAANNFSSAEHGGTHIDAPIHFAENAQTVDEIPLEKLIGNAIKIDVSENAAKDDDYLISIEDIKSWEENEELKIPDGSIILLYTGFSKYYPNKSKYLGTDERGEEAIEKLHFPGLSEEAAKWLVEQRNINAIGIDTPSIDYGQSTYFRSHVILLSEHIPVFENLTNLEKLPSNNFEVIALPMKIKDGSGAPLRIVAMVKE